ncbi:hypothetical protein MKK69_06600 [Methylobacterium sp. J-026]|uniref:hypothetical protein n=1 Tax=Methylobacterium sp. J-026 TaxID=2836624 RepID=UPI001FBB2ADB|nr:hypothetical protein [Methylobacterium sp. J-026]MCJ2133742.1 hypothetical protein [Methylobacterium sp. J-026]
MSTHPEFDELTERFFQDVDRIFSTEAELLQFAIEPFSEERRLSLRAYLSLIASDDFDGKELLNLWNDSKAQWLFHSAPPLRLLLNKFRDRL